MSKIHIINIDCDADITSVITAFRESGFSFTLDVKKDSSFSINTPIDPDKLWDKLTISNGNNDMIIALTSRPLSNNYFSLTNRDYSKAVITTDQSELYVPQFTIEEYLQEEILSTALLMQAKMNIGHYDTRGCLFDFCENKADIAIKLYTGSICSDCRARLEYYGVPPSDVIAAQRLLWRISKDFHSGKVNRGCPIGNSVCIEYQNIQREYSEKNIFFATSFSENFLDSADHLRSKLKEIGFNLHIVNEQITNRNILCKICRTMQTCKYGIAEFSGFRHNVSYEFGLMQAFGLKSIAVVKQDSFSKFESEISDMKGIEVIPYRTIASDLFDRIKDFIE